MFHNKGSEIIPNEGRIYAYDQDIGLNTTITYHLLTSSKKRERYINTIYWNFWSLDNYLSINKYTGVIALYSKLFSIGQFDLLIKVKIFNCIFSWYKIEKFLCL